MDSQRRRANVVLPALSILSLLASIASISLMLFEFNLPIPSGPVPHAVAAGALAGATGLFAVVSGALQRQPYVWMLFGIIGMGVGIATGLTMMQAG